MIITHFNKPPIGKVVQHEEPFSQLIAADTSIELLAEGFEWAEGPVWLKSHQCLLFSDVPTNTIYKYTDNQEVEVFLNPSGYTGKGYYSKEPGSNGLIINNNAELVACEHGDRRLTTMPLEHQGKYTLADNFNGKRFNSPNDLVQNSRGVYYFTDPPYGLPDLQKSEIGLFGVYALNERNKANLIIKHLSRPNGVALSPDEKTLYVAQSDPEHPYIFKYELKNDFEIARESILYDCTPLVKQKLKGLPDGLKTDKFGNIFTTAPGGILVLDPTGKLLGSIETGEAISNCNWGNDGSYLYFTSDMYLCRIKTNTIGKGFD